jgi:membrane-associated protease RseP (regulator of RpoE activity)
VVVKIDGHAIKTDDTELEKVLQANAGKRVLLTVKRDGRERTVVVVPVNRRLHPEAGTVALARHGPPVGAIGVSLTTPSHLVRANPIAGIGQAGSGFASTTEELMGSLATFFSAHGLSGYLSQVTGRHTSGSSSSSPPPRLFSVVGAGKLAIEAARAGTGDVLILLIEINIFVGIFNMFPMLPLDGGHVAIAIYERIRSRRGRVYHANVAKLMPATYIVLTLMLALGLTAAYLDVIHPLPNPFQ